MSGAITDPGPPENPGRERLRGRPLARPLNVVLVEPEIPPNTGNIARLCAATGCSLHLVHPLGFEVSEKAVRRAGLDYWHLVSVVEHPDYEHFDEGFRREPNPGTAYLFTGKAERSFLDVPYRPGDALVFGRESVGLSDSLVDSGKGVPVGIPMPGQVRSLNLSNAVALGVYEALRQTGALADPSKS